MHANKACQKRGEEKQRTHTLISVRDVHVYSIFTTELYMLYACWCYHRCQHRHRLLPLENWQTVNNFLHNVCTQNFNYYYTLMHVRVTCKWTLPQFVESVLSFFFFGGSNCYCCCSAIKSSFEVSHTIIITQTHTNILLIGWKFNLLMAKSFTPPPPKKVR